MKKTFFFIALCALAINAVAGNFSYKCGITSVEFDDSQNQTNKHIFVLTIKHTGKNTANYNNSTTYDATVKITVTSDDGTLEGTYSTDGFVGTGTTYDQNYIVTTSVPTHINVVGYNERYLNLDKTSTLTIRKEGENTYSISEGTLHFVDNQFNPSNYYVYKYNYSVADLQNPDAPQVPFVFSIDTEFHQKVYNYDITVNGISVIRDDTDYSTKRYFMTLNCVGKNRETNEERNYEIQLAIYPNVANIVGTYGTQEGNPLFPSYSYVKDLKINKTRYLANDSSSTVQIKSKGDKLYSFHGGTLICTDIDLAYIEVSGGQKRIEAVHYYHFNDNGGAGVEFGFDENQTVFDLNPTQVTVEEQSDGYQLTVNASDGSANYTVILELTGEQLSGTFTFDNTLSAWSKVERGSSSSYVTSGSTITITDKGNNTYTISGNLLCENGNTYTLHAFDFQHGGTNPGGGENDNIFHVTATKVDIKDETVDKSHFDITVEAHTSKGEYEMGFDVWPAIHSAIGSFSASDGTINYYYSWVHKSKANDNPVDMEYECQTNSAISLTIVSNGDGTCTLNGSIQAMRSHVMYTYIIAPFTFDYEEEPVDPGTEDPYRFEPAEATTIHFVGDVVSFRERDTYIEVTLNEMANETYNWIELRLLSDTLDMPAGTYNIDNSGEAGSLTASRGYLGVQNDDPCYVAIRDQENWGQYTPYYLVSGSLNVNFNTKGDSIFVTGTAFSHNGSTIHVNVKSYNMLYVEGEQPKEPEFVTLDVDTVLITYLSNESDSINNRFVYTFNFSKADDYPTVLVNVILSKPMELVAGTYSLADGTLSGLQLAQNQSDFEMNLYYGSAYDFTAATLTLTQEADGTWRYDMFMTDAIGSEYQFNFTQNPHIILYPQQEVDPKDQPFIDESQTVATITTHLDVLLWDSKTVETDGMIDIHLYQEEADETGLRAYLYLWMYTPVAYPAADTYPVLGTEEDYTFSSSMGRYGNAFFPCYLMLMDEEGWAHAVWYITGGEIMLSYDANNQPILSGVCTTYWGSTIIFDYSPKDTEGVEEVQSNKVQSTKVLRDGQIVILRDGKEYNHLGAQQR